MNSETSSPDQLLLALGFSNVPLPVMGGAFDAMHANCLMEFPTDPGFVERAARYSCFSSVNQGSSQMGEGEFGSGKEDSSVTDPAFANGESNVKKRKAVCKRRVVKVVEEHGLSAKKCRSRESCGIEKDGWRPKEEDDVVVEEKKHGKDDGEKVVEPFKDYIHVRARRGQATDSHSLAERVRREKISQRMKFLQDLVPGCNKITGKALMLDEIINYVQAMQRQVEFLSMKLATVNLGLDFSLENLISKEHLLNQANTCLSSSIYPMGNLPVSINFGHGSNEENSVAFTLANGIDTHCSIGQLDSTLNQAAIMQTALEMFGASSASQAENVWDDELRSVLQSSFGQNQELGATSQSFHGQLSAGHMKIEL